MDALTCLAVAWTRWYGVWEAVGFSSIRDAWLARAAGLGQRIHARLSGEEAVGNFEGIDATGGLLLRENTGRLRTIAAGDVYF
ncbi:MAG TPA: hypothetical protein VJ718_07430, partial [Candidatus Binataceae bacterium]|nr:hypothetical protein [Candidatus Binataceae bacterium]